MRAPTPGVTLAAVATVVVVAVAVTGAAAASVRPAPAPGSPDRPSTVPVTDSVVVCPRVGSNDKGTTSLVRAASPGASGTIELRPLGGSTTAVPLARADSAGSVLQYAPKAGRAVGPLLVHATGERAAGLTAQVATLVPGGARRALTSVPCTAPSGETWLVGGSTVSGRRDVLYLTNADSSPAVVDVTVFGPDGASHPSQAQGLTVAPLKQVVLALDALAPGLEVTAVQVHTRSGRVAAALQDAWALGGTPEGADWVPPSVRPSQSFTVTGLPAETSAQPTLFLLAPGQDDATVRVRFATADGLLSPEGVNAIDVPAGQVQTVDLRKAAPGVAAPYALVVDADHPVVAGVQTVEGGRHLLPDFSWTAGSPEVVGAAVVAPWVPRTAAVTTALQITAVGTDDVVVRVTTLGADGTDAGQHEYTVQPGRTVQVVPGKASLGQGAALVEVPDGARVVVGTSTLDRAYYGPMITGGPLIQTPVRTLQPPAVSDPAVGFPGH
jgi:hypothetical protein